MFLLKVKHQRTLGRLLYSQKFWNFQNKGKWHGHYLKKFPETPKIWKHVPFNRKLQNGVGKREETVFNDTFKIFTQDLLWP